jgi:hypothetical protein
MNASSIVSRASKLQTRARIAEAGLQAAVARNWPSAACSATVSPLPGAPSTAAIAPENTQGCFSRSDFSRPTCSVYAMHARFRIRRR